MLYKIQNIDFPTKILYSIPHQICDHIAQFPTEYGSVLWLRLERYIDPDKTKKTKHQYMTA